MVSPWLAGAAGTAYPNPNPTPTACKARLGDVVGPDASFVLSYIAIKFFEAAKEHSSNPDDQPRMVEELATSMQVCGMMPGTRMWCQNAVRGFGVRVWH